LSGTSDDLTGPSDEVAGEEIERPSLTDELIGLLSSKVVGQAHAL